MDPDAPVQDVPARGGFSARGFPAAQFGRGRALDGADELRRHERVVLTGRQAAPTGLRPLRSGPAGRRLRARDRGRAPDQGAARRGRAAGVCEDERRRRHPCRRADHPPFDFRADLRLRRARLAAARAEPSRQGDDGMAEEEAARRPRRPSPERLGEDDRIRLLGPPKARRPRVHTVAVGGAGIRSPPERFRDGRRAGADRSAR